MANYSVQHSGIKGMKWGIRRFQNEDGSLTPEGRARYGVEERQARAERFKSVAKKVGIGLGAAAAIGGAAYGGVKLSKWLSNPANARLVKRRIVAGKDKVRNLINSGGRLAKNVARDVGTAASGAYNTASKWASGAYSDAMEWGTGAFKTASHKGYQLYLGLTGKKLMGKFKK